MRQGNEALHGFSALSIDAEIAAGDGDALLGDSLGGRRRGL
ncbi:hypothetical protein ACH4MN_32245 [Streptomyces anulatus]